MAAETYVPVATRRFDVSPDPISQDRYYAVLGATATLRGEAKFYAGASLYGSLVKGKPLTQETSTETDIDIVAFYNPWLVDFHDYPTPETWISAELTRRAMVAMRPASLPSDFHLAVRELSHEGDTSVLGRVIKLIEGSVDQDELQRQMVTISAFFGHNAGGGLDCYRRSFFKQLTTLYDQQQADKLWKFISERIIKPVERGAHGSLSQTIPESLAAEYPPTVQGALKYFKIAL